jgi:hypothetical protein
VVVVAEVFVFLPRFAILLAPVWIALLRVGATALTTFPAQLDCKKLLTFDAAFCIPENIPPRLDDPDEVGVDVGDAVFAATVLPAPVIGAIVGVVVFAREALIAAATSPPLALACAMVEFTAIFIC